MDDVTVRDRYRVEVTSGSWLRTMAAGFVRRRGNAGRVSIIDTAGRVVWSRECSSAEERHNLVRVIEEQVFPARLQDFERWLRENPS